MIKSDFLIETHHYRRVIRLKKGLTLKTKKYLGPDGTRERIEFQVTQLSLFWREGEPVEYVMAYGYGRNNKKFGCRRRYSPEKLPQELRDIIGDQLKVPRIAEE